VYADLSPVVRGLLSGGVRALGQEEGDPLRALPGRARPAGEPPEAGGGVPRLLPELATRRSDRVFRPLVADESRRQRDHGRVHRRAELLGEDDLVPVRQRDDHRRLRRRAVLDVLPAVAVEKPQVLSLEEQLGFGHREASSIARSKS
jgi:hypothetical protein